jgi:hypothetical protein
VTASLGTRFAGGLVALLLAAGSSMSAARADETHAPLDLPSPTTDSGHHGEVPRPSMARLFDGGNVREYRDGDELTYRMKVEQTLHAKGPHTAEPQTSTLDLTLTESVKVRDGRPAVTLEITEAQAEGFLAEAEESSALERKVTFAPGDDDLRLLLKAGEDGEPDLLDPETIRPFGDLGAVRMADLALRAHLLNPVIPSEEFSEGDNFDDNAAFPAGWTRGPQTLDGSISIEGTGEQDGREVVRVNGVHVTTDTLLRVTAMDNAVEALQGLAPPVPNDFFAGTLFHALFPKGSTYESLMPKLPLSVSLEPRRRLPASPKRRRRRGLGLALGCLLMLGLASCKVPQRNPDVVSLNMSGPVQLNHESVVDRSTGVLISSEVSATARLTGNVYPIPEVLVPHLVPEVNALSGAPIGMDADWTITEELRTDLPEAAAAAGSGGALVPVGLGLVLVLGAGTVALVRRRRSSKEPSGSEPSDQAGEDKPAPQPAGAGTESEA